MNKTLINICVLIFCVRKCFGVGLDYFVERESKLSAAEDEFFMTDKSEKAVTASRTPYRRNDDSTCTLEDEKFSKINASRDNNGKPIKEAHETTVSRIQLQFLNNRFDEDGDTWLRAFPPAVEEDELFLAKEHVTKVPTKNNSSTRSKLYSLEPAIKTFNLTDLHAVPDVNKWFVLDRAPCWELPLIYGRVGEKNRHVFSIYRSIIKDVIYDDVHEVKRNDMYYEIPDPLIKNKWCEMKPCYGDHVLCDKRKDESSKVCGVGFIARAPTIAQQKAILNTVNSLRNHVARGSLDEYPYLQPAANMRQIVYDKDLESMAVAWVRQCLPGPAPCASLDDHLVTQLECTKFHNKCCLDLDPLTSDLNCTPDHDCMVEPVIGCLHTWFWSAGHHIKNTDISCGHIEETTFNLAQLIWAETDKIGCAYGSKQSGDVRVICSFAPGARYFIKTDYFCGVLELQPRDNYIPNVTDVTDLEFVKQSNILMRVIEPGIRFQITERNLTSKYKNHSINDHVDISPRNEWGVASLSKIYKEGWTRHHANVFSNGTFGMLARLVTRYSFEEETRARCDVNYPIYVIGEPASLCSETGAQFKALCFDYADPTPGYRLAAILASMSLFTLILFDLFRSSVRQGTY